MKLPGTHPALPALLAGSALIVAWWTYGWRGLLFGLTLLVFWLLLQFSRAARLLRAAGERPLGQVDSVAMVQAQLEHGLHMDELLRITGSLGRKVGPLDDWQWSDGYGNDLVVSLRRGVVVRWAIARAADEAPATNTEADRTAPPQA
ncbi:MAG: hypothetical protein RLY71_996 [Pseudomonadota bacterium]|jgi:hypothetical protein